MATIRTYTTIEQSRKLTEILPPESADMYWWPTSLRYYIEAIDDGDFNEAEGCIRAWSLTALLNVLPSATLDSSDDHYYRVRCMKKYTEWYDNPVDTCVAMIEKLHELKLLL